jgi:hypothetical protein
MTFLIQYDRSQGRIVKLESFDAKDRKAAEALRLKIELELNRANIDHEVVLLEAPDKDALLRTHRRYFKSLEEIIHS